MQSRDAILEKVRSSPRIPAPSQAVFKILELTRDPECDIKLVSEAIRRDGGLTAQLLREANSALYGFNTPTSAPEEACMRLGLKRVRAAVLNQHVVDGLGRSKPEGFDASRYWQAAFATSVAAHDLSVQLCPASAADAGTAGLLCDLGVGMLAFGIPEQYAAVLSRLKQPSAPPLWEIEQVSLGVTHAEIGAEIMKDWKLDDNLTTAVRFHHVDPCEPQDGDQPLLVHIVAAAVTLSEIALGGSDMDRVTRLFMQIEPMTQDPDGLVQKLLETLVSHIQETAKTLKVELGKVDNINANFEDLMRDIPDVGASLSYKPMERPSID